MHADLREACLRALKLSRSEVRQRAETFSWSAATDQILAAFQRIPRDTLTAQLDSPASAGSAP